MRYALALALALAFACGDNNIATPLHSTVASFPSAQNPDLDLLFLVDNTVSGNAERALGDDSSQLFTALAALPDGSPSLHIGFATSDLGTLGTDSATPAPSLGNCAGSGLDGRLITPGATLPEPYLVISNGSQNFSGSPSDQVSAVVKGIGVAGCGFEQHLAGIARAFANPANTGFRRATANLAIVVLADEDDCSVLDPSFFSPDTATLGPLESFRCTRWGVTCDQPLDSLGAKTNCRPATDSPYVSDVAPFVDAVTAVEPDPYHRAVFAIVGDPSPVAIEDRNIGGSDQLALGHSCSYTDSSGGLEVADPAVRIAAWAAALDGAWATVCRDDDTPTMSQLSAQLTTLVAGDPCIHAPVDPDSCTAADVDDLTGARTPVGSPSPPPPRAPARTARPSRAPRRPACRRTSRSPAIS